MIGHNSVVFLKNILILLQISIVNKVIILTQFPIVSAAHIISSKRMFRQIYRDTHSGCES